MFYKKTNILSFIIFYLIIIFAITFIYIKDPYTIFHNFQKNRVTTNFRIQNYGLIKYKNFDSIAIGTCHFTNLLKKNLDNVIENSDFINLSTEGFTFYERYLILDYAFSQKKIKNVITTFDNLFKKEKKIENTFYENLYLDKFKGKWEVYLNSNALSCVFFNKNCDYIDYDKNKMLYGIGLKTDFGFENLVKFGYETLNKLINTDFFPLDIKDYKSIIDNEILSLVKKHPETQFYFVIPTYNAVYWKIDITKLDKFYEVLSYILVKSKNYNNVHFYWFYNETYPYNFDRYLELAHYDYKITLEQIEKIQNKNYVIDFNNYKQKFKNFRKKIDNFDIDFYKRKVDGLKNDKL